MTIIVLNVIVSLLVGINHLNYFKGRTSAYLIGGSAVILSVIAIQSFYSDNIVAIVFGTIANMLIYLFTSITVSDLNNNKFNTVKTILFGVIISFLLYWIFNNTLKDSTREVIYEPDVKYKKEIQKLNESIKDKEFKIIKLEKEIEKYESKIITIDSVLYDNNNYQDHIDFLNEIFNKYEEQENESN
jgi:predicted PurR-regulated permease PerM